MQLPDTILSSELGKSRVSETWRVKMTALLPSNARQMPTGCPGGAREAQAGAPVAQRILIVTDAWAPQVNGVVRSYENLVCELRRLRHRVEIVSPQLFMTISLPGYDEIALALGPYRKLARWIEEFSPDILHIAVEGPLGWAARRYCRRHDLPFSTAFHTNCPAYIALRAPRLIRKPLERMTRMLLRRFHGAAQHTFVATPSLEAQLRGWGFAGSLRRLSRGVNADLFFPPPERPQAEVPVLLYVGRVAVEKNLEAFLSLTEAETGRVHKVVVGDGPALAALRKAYPDVTFRGVLAGQVLAAAYRSADVFVFPSRTDTFGIVMIEALACGLPIAAHDVPGPRDIVTEASLGVLDDDLGLAIRRALVAPGTSARTVARTPMHSIAGARSRRVSSITLHDARSRLLRTRLSGKWILSPCDPRGASLWRVS